VTRGVVLLVLGAVATAACSGPHPSGARSATSPASALAASHHTPHPIRLGRRIGHPVRADVDGDRRSDIIVMRRVSSRHQRVALIARTAAGRRITTLIDDRLAGASSYVMAAHDIGGNDGAEVFTFAGGNTALAATIYTLRHGQLIRVRRTRGDFYVPYFAAGNSCGSCQVAAHCVTLAGKPRLVETFAQPLSRRGRNLNEFERQRTHDQAPDAAHRYQWRVSVFAINGFRALRLRTRHGTEPPYQPLPPKWRFGRGLHC
jgi:hypothetical protein